MLVHNDHTASLGTPPALSLGEEAWTTAGGPRWPSNLAEQAHVLQACQRVRGIATPHDLWRALLAYGLGPLSPRRLGAWAGLVGRAALAEAAWRKRLRASNDWLLWLLGARLAAPETPTLPCPRPAGRLILVDARPLGQPGGTGDDWRLPRAYDFLAGRMHQGCVTDRYGGEHLERYRWHPGEVIVADRGYGYRRSGAPARRQQADVVVRIHPAPLPLATEAGQRCNVLRWLRQRGGAEREWRGGCCWAAQRYPVRLSAATLAPPATRRARQRARRKAHKARRTLTAPTVAVAGWLLLITPLAAGIWAPADVRSIYRARWQVELVLNKMKQLLRLNQIRRPHLARVEATVRAGLVAWALHADTTTQLRTLCRARASPEALGVSSGLLSGLGLDTLRQQGPGRWSAARLQACLPRLRRFVCTRPRQRMHQDSTVRAWREQRAHAFPARRHKVA
jgi:hypothetical protein